MWTTFSLIALVLCGVIGGYFIIPHTQEPSQPGQYVWTGVEPVRAETTQAFILPIAQTNYLPVRDLSVPDPVLDAQAALLYDARSGRILFDKQASARVPVASLTKIVSALVAIELFDPDHVVTVVPEAIKVDDEKQDLYAYEKLTVRDLLYFMLVGSSNDAAYALAFHAREQGIDFVARMNDIAGKLGMDDTYFLDPAGLNDKGFSSARDFIKLVLAALKKGTLWPATQEAEITVNAQSGQVHVIKNTNKLLDNIPNIIASKTGYTDGALGCLLLAVKLPEEDDILISVVLGSRERFTDTELLIEWALQAHRWR